MQRAILPYLNDHPKANRNELTGAIPNASTDGIKYNLARLQQIGLLKRIGSTRYGHWEVVLPNREINGSTLTIQKISISKK